MLPIEGRCATAVDGAWSLRAAIICGARFLAGATLLALATLGPAASLLPQSPSQSAAGNTVGGRGPSTLVYPPYRHTYGIHKARTPHLKLFLGGRTVFSDPQGVAAVKLAQDDKPDVKGDDYQLTVFGLNSGRGEIIYNSSMQTLAMYGTHGSREGQFDHPRTIAADVDGNVYVADTGNRRVVRLIWRDRQLRWVGLVPGTYRQPWGVGTAPPGAELYISDRLGNQVYRWTPPGAVAEGSAAPTQGAKTGTDGDPVAVFASGITRPTALAVIDKNERWLRGKEDALYVVHEDGARLSKFDPSGSLLATTSTAEREPLRAAPRFAHVAVDFYGNVYATDTANGRIYKFKSDLSFLTAYGEPGEGEHQLVEPRGIAIWKRFGQVFVAEREGAQYFFVGTDMRLPEGPLPVEALEANGQRHYAFKIFFTEPSELTLSFLSKSGAVVDSLTLPSPLDSGEVLVTVAEQDLVADLEQRATRIVLQPRPTYSSRRRFARRIEREIEWRITSTGASSVGSGSRGPALSRWGADLADGEGATSRAISRRR
jgi:hypothetical protein